MMTSLKATVVIGRFQPFHKGHLNLIRTAQEYAPHTCILLGSHNHTRTLKNVWTTEERLSMMVPCFSEEELKRLTFIPLNDDSSDTTWVAQVKDAVTQCIKKKGPIGLIGYEKDTSSYYLKLFKPWILIKAQKFCDGLSGTDLRQAYFDGLPPSPTYFPDPVIQFLCDFRKTKDYTYVKDTLYGKTHD